MKSKVFLGLILTLCIMMLFTTSSATEPKMGGALKLVPVKAGNGDPVFLCTKGPFFFVLFECKQ
jgi:hypothetical protein